MTLYLLCRTTCLNAYYDSDNDWLYLDWHGAGTLSLVQEACVALADCFLRRPYALVLNNNERVLDVSWGVAPWLVTDFLHLLSLAGIEHVAWVSSPALPALAKVHTVLTLLPSSLITSFRDLADAVTWLQQKHAERPRLVEMSQHTPETEAKLTLTVQLLRERMAAK